MRIDWLSKLVLAGMILGSALVFTDLAVAGTPVPLPLAGALGPFGLLAAGAAVGGYLLVKKLRSPR